MVWAFRLQEPYMLHTYVRTYYVHAYARCVVPLLEGSRHTLSTPTGPQG